MVAVDDRREGTDCPLTIVDDGVNGRILDDVEVLPQMLILLVELHQLEAVHLLGLVKGLELDISRCARLVGEGALDGVEIMSADCDEGTLPREVLVELILQRDEAVVTFLVEVDVTKDCAGDVWSDLGGLPNFETTVSDAFFLTLDALEKVCAPPP